MPRTSSNLNINIFSQLMKIFDKNNWDYRTGIKDNYNETLINLLNFVKNLNNEEQRLVLKLTKNFLHCRFLDYSRLLEKAFRKIPNDLVLKSKRIFLIPILKPGDEGKAKSSTLLPYPCQHLVIPKIQSFNGKTINTPAYTNLLKEKFSSRKQSLIIFLDDYIGSGDTTISALKQYEEFKSVSDTPIIVAIVAQKTGINTITNAGVPVFTAYEKERGISDDPTIKNKLQAIKCMRRIEKRLGIEKPQNGEKDLRLGYARSQALVSMIRTPNNTFPIYWWSKKFDGKKWNGIFRR